MVTWANKNIYWEKWHRVFFPMLVKFQSAEPRDEANSLNKPKVNMFFSYGVHWRMTGIYWGYPSPKALSISMYNYQVVCLSSSNSSIIFVSVYRLIDWRFPIHCIFLPAGTCILKIRKYVARNSSSVNIPAKRLDKQFGRKLRKTSMPNIQTYCFRSHDAEEKTANPISFINSVVDYYMLSKCSLY